MSNSIRKVDAAVRAYIHFCQKYNHNGVSAKELKELIWEKEPELRELVHQYSLPTALRRAGYRQKLGYIPTRQEGWRRGKTRGKTGRIWYPKNSSVFVKDRRRGRGVRDEHGRFCSDEHSNEARP